MSPIRNRVSAGFCLLAVWFAAANGWEPLAAVLTAAAVHEGGHILALRWCGARVMGFRLGICGAVLETDCTRLSYGQELAVILAGPAANLFGASVLRLLGGHWPACTGANLLLCAFNLLPIRPLDGGRALYLLTSWAAGPAVGEWAARWIGAAGAVSVACAAGYLMWNSGGSLWLLPAAAGLCLSALQESRGISA